MRRGSAQSMERIAGLSQNNITPVRLMATGPGILMIWLAQYSLSMGKYWARLSGWRLPIFFNDPSQCNIIARERAEQRVRPGACNAVARG
jgi:hypothetical protein